jgi:hypothetical protein
VAPPRKGPFKGKGADSRAARREAPATRGIAAPASEPCAKPDRRSVQGWTLIGAIAVGTTNLPLAQQAAARARPVLQDEGDCRIGAVRLRWMRLARFYRHIGALP